MIIQQIRGQEKNRNQNYCATSTSGSPSPLSVVTSASEAFGYVHIDDVQKSEICDQIQSNNVEEIQRNQDKKHWGKEEQMLLLALHSKLGNKWIEIAKELPGKDHNSVKNHFYAKIRKSLRRINFFIKIYFNKQLKQLNLSHVSKMVTMMSEKKQGSESNEVTESNIMEIKDFLFEMSEKQETDQLDKLAQQKIEASVNQIFYLLEAVKKNCSVSKSNQLKYKQKSLQVIRKSARQPKTTTIPVRKDQSLNLNLNIEMKPIFSDVCNSSSNMMVVLMPWPQTQVQSSINCMDANLYNYSWMNPMQQCMYFGSNIFGSS